MGKTKEKVTNYFFPSLYYYILQYKIRSSGVNGYCKLSNDQAVLVSQSTMGIEYIITKINEDSTETFVNNHSCKNASIYLETLCNYIFASCIKCYRANVDKFSNMKYEVFS